MEKTIKAILLTNNQILISQIDEVAASVPGEPDCKLTNQFAIWFSRNRCSNFINLTDQNLVVRQ